MPKAIVEATPIKSRKEKPIREFKLLPNVGNHFEPNPEFDPEFPDDDENIRDIEYESGDIVKSRRELDKVFANKFTRQVHEDDEPELVEAPGTTIPQDVENDPFRDVPVRSAEAANKKEAGRFLSEEELEGKPELQKMARGKVKSAINDDEDEDEEDEDVEESAEPEDVTDDFEGAADANITVKKDSEGLYRAFHSDDPDSPMQGSKKGFSTKTKMTKFIKKHSQG